MDEYIERDAVLNCLKIARGYCPCAYEEITKLSAADVAPVMHGQWIGVDSSFWKSRHDTDIPVFRKTYRCPFCARRTAIMENYCPNCGAKMDGGRGNG